MNNVKALVIQMPLEVDLHNVIQVARAEGMKLYKSPGKIKVLDMVSRPYGWIVVVQNGDGSISKQAKNE